MVVLGPCGETGAGSEWKASAGIVLVRGAESLRHRRVSSLLPHSWPVVGLACHRPHQQELTHLERGLPTEEPQVPTAAPPDSMVGKSPVPSTSSALPPLRF